MGKLIASMIIEILGRPANHVSEAMLSIIEKLGKEKGVKIISKKINPPKPLEEKKDLFITFAELEVELDSILNYFGVIFAYMPSHIELVSPSKIEMANFDLNTFANQLILRLHDYDALAKNVIAEKNAILQKLREVAPYLFKPVEQANNPSAHPAQAQIPQKNSQVKKSKAKKKSKKK